MDVKRKPRFIDDTCGIIVTKEVERKWTTYYKKGDPRRRE